MVSSTLIALVCGTLLVDLLPAVLGHQLSHPEPFLPCPWAAGCSSGPPANLVLLQAQGITSEASVPTVTMLCVLSVCSLDEKLHLEPCGHLPGITEAAQRLQDCRDEAGLEQW